MRKILNLLPILKISDNNFTSILSSLVFGLIIFITIIPNIVQSQTTIRESVTSHGITWQFSESVEVGQFVNGDYYVVGPVTVVSISPLPGNGRNGSVVNVPISQNRSGFDDRTSNGRYDPTLSAQLPINLESGDALVSSISVETFGALPRPFRPGDSSLSPVQSVSVLTCLNQAVSSDAFRPSYCDRSHRLYYANNLRRDLLPSLTRVQNTPDLNRYADAFERPWLEVCFFSFDAAAEYQAQYAREEGRVAGIVTLLLMLDFTEEEKERLLINYVQHGIDLWGIVRAGYPGWQAHGGHGSGRKWPIIFAGILLNDSEMRSPTITYPNVKFGEDMQTMYANGWTGTNVVYGGHMGPDGDEVQQGWGPYEHLHPSQWTSNIGENYRRCCTSIAWVGQALAARLMGAREYWNHNAFFEYVDRWMTEDDSEHVVEILNSFGEDYSASWQRQGQTWDTFVNEMWDTYRTTISSTSDKKQFVPPNKYELNQNYPNPFNPSTKIRYSLKNKEIVNIEVYNALGQKIETLINSQMAAGQYEIEFNTKNLPGGIYFYRIRAGEFQDVRKMVLLK